MKNPSLVLRSSKIKGISQPYRLSTVDYLESLKNTQSNSLQKHAQGQQNEEDISKERSKESQKDKQLKERLNKLTTNLKVLEKRYKQNLKQGFDDKIKSYRLEAVMERKLLKQTIDHSLRAREEESLIQKHGRTEEQKQYEKQQVRKRSHNKKNQLRKLKENVDLQRRQWQRDILQNSKEEFVRNRSLHDRVLEEEQQQKGKKKKYMQYWRKQQTVREEFECKKEYLQKIVHNTKRIRDLKQELKDIQERVGSIVSEDYDLKTNRSSLFVTM